MKRYARIYVQFLKQYLKTLLEYKEDFIYGILGFFLVQATSIIFISLILSNIPSLSGWSFYEIIFIYGFSQIPRGIDHIFTDYLWIFSGRSIVRGEFDKIFINLYNPLCFYRILPWNISPWKGKLLHGGYINFNSRYFINSCIIQNMA